MSLRDYFAAQAMQGLQENSAPEIRIMCHSVEEIARIAYEMADAMLKEREK